jgi:acyl-CoA dehydrogenase family protein 9
VALSVLKPLGDELKLLTDFDLSDPTRLVGAWAGYVGGRLKREVRPDSVTLADDALSELASPVAEQVKRLRSVSEGVLRRYGREVTDQGMHHKRLTAALADVYAQVAVLSRVTSIFADQGAEASGQERYIAETFCTRAARRVGLELDKIESNDDERMHSIARLAYKRGAYGYALFED